MLDSRKKIDGPQFFVKISCLVSFKKVLKRSRFDHPLKMSAPNLNAACFQVAKNVRLFKITVERDLCLQKGNNWWLITLSHFASLRLLKTNFTLTSVTKSFALITQNTHKNKDHDRNFDLQLEFASFITKRRDNVESYYCSMA